MSTKQKEEILKLNQQASSLTFRIKARNKLLDLTMYTGLGLHFQKRKLDADTEMYLEEVEKSIIGRKLVVREAKKEMISKFRSFVEAKLRYPDKMPIKDDLDFIRFLEKELGKKG